MLPAIGLLVGLMFMPESPRWLARKGRWDEAKAVLTLVHGKGDPNSPVAANELDDIKKAVEIEAAAANVTYFDLLRPNMINRTHIGLFMQIWSQLTGRFLRRECCSDIHANSFPRHECHDVLYHLRLHHGGRDIQHTAGLVIDPVRHQREYSVPFTNIAYKTKHTFRSS